MKSSDPAERREAVEMLAPDPKLARTAVLHLLDAITDPDEQVREDAFSVLENMGTPNSQDVQAISERLDSGNADQAYWAATLLGRLGPLSQPAVEALTKQLSAAAEVHVRERAAWALGEIGIGAQDALPTLGIAAQNGSQRLAKLARSAIEAITQRPLSRPDEV